MSPLGDQWNPQTDLYDEHLSLGNPRTVKSSSGSHQIALVLTVVKQKNPDGQMTLVSRKQTVDQGLHEENETRWKKSMFYSSALQKGLHDLLQTSAWLQRHYFENVSAEVSVPGVLKGKAQRSIRFPGTRMQRNQCHQSRCRQMEVGNLCSFEGHAADASRERLV